MSHVTTTQFQTSIRQWIAHSEWHAPFAVTLTMRQCVTFQNGFSSTKLWLTESAAVQNLRHFLNRLNRSVFGKAASRYGKGVGCIPVLEGGGDKRLHYHAIIDCPRSELCADFPLFIADHWRSTQWGYWQVDCQPNADLGWLTYITKFRDKPDFADAIDWTNLRLP